MAIANITNNILTDSGIATSSLLPLSGGTLTGALSSTFVGQFLDNTGASTSSKIIRISNTGADMAIGIEGSTPTEIPLAEGGIAYSTVLKSVGTTSLILGTLSKAALTINTSQQVTLTQNLSGTTATFSSTIAAGGAIKTSGLNSVNEASVLKFSQESSTVSQIAVYGATTGTAGILNIVLKSSDASVNTVALSLASTGAATFQQTSTSAESTLTLSNLSTASNVTKGSRFIFRLTDTVGTVKDAGYISVYPTTSNPNIENAYMAFSTRTSDAAPSGKMWILANGRVGINTNAPDARLEVQLGNGNVSAGLFYNYTGDVTATLLISRCGTTSGFYHFQAFSTTTTEVFRIESNGNVKNTNNSYGSLSDIKIKDNVTDATPKLEDLLKVRIRNYNIIGQDVKQIGVIAQELEEIFPSMVDENEDFEEIKKINEEGNSIIEKKSLGTFTKGVKYSVFVPILIKAIQEQQAQIQNLQEQNQDLKARLDKAGL